jgi:hypothetical protein
MLDSMATPLHLLQDAFVPAKLLSKQREAFLQTSHDRESALLVGNRQRQRLLNGLRAAKFRGTLAVEKEST